MRNPDPDYIWNSQFLIGALRREERTMDDVTHEITHDVAAIGHNKGTIDFAREAMNVVSHWLRDNPVIETADSARVANDVLTSALLTLKDLDDQRKTQTEPLNRQLAAINSVFKSIRVPFDAAVNELKRRLLAYVTAEEQKRAAAAARLRAEAEALEQAARDAELREQEAIASADVGECTDVGTVIEEADAAFNEYSSARREAIIAERDVPVRLRSRFGTRVRTARNSEVLECTNAIAALQAMGAGDKVKEAICAEARLYRKTNGSLPPGVIGKITRSL